MNVTLLSSVPSLAFFSALMAVVVAIPAAAQVDMDDLPDSIPIWENGAPGFESRRDEPEKWDGKNIITNVHNPSITPYLPDAKMATGAAVIICPGGGHFKLSIKHEGYTVGAWLRDHGVSAFVLK